MTSPSFSRSSVFDALRGPFNFLDSRPASVALEHADLLRCLPAPQPLFLANDGSTPLAGFARLPSRAEHKFQRALVTWIEVEEANLLRGLAEGRSAATAASDGAWTAVAQQLGDVLRNLSRTSVGSTPLAVFWLYFSGLVAGLLRGTPTRVRNLDLERGKSHGEALRFVILFRLLDRVRDLADEQLSPAGTKAELAREAMLMRLLQILRDNVVVFTEEHIGKDLAELGGYLRGYLRLDAADFFFRLAQLRTWHREEVARDPRLRSVAEAILGPPLSEHPDRLLTARGYLAHLTQHPNYDPARFLTRSEVGLWTHLVHKLAEFELINSLRRLVVEVTPSGNGFACDPRGAARLGAGATPVRLSPETRPYDLFSAQVVEPEISRCGLIYDIVEFSSTVSVVRLGDRENQALAYEQLHAFQTEVEQIAHEHRLRREKFLGDGAFFSGRETERTLAAAILIRRSYEGAVRRRFLFSQGIRIGINLGNYRLLPSPGPADRRDEQYEVYGHGLVELTRLVSGKSSWSFDELRSLLLARGFEARAVDEFLQPLVRNEGGRTEAESAAFVSADGNLVNDGIVTTERFISRLSRNDLAPYFIVRLGELRFVAFRLKLDEGEPLVVGMRRLGVARLKGLGELPVFEVRDGQDWTLPEETAFSGVGLMVALQQLYTASATTARSRNR